MSAREPAAGDGWADPRLQVFDPAEWPTGVQAWRHARINELLALPGRANSESNLLAEYRQQVGDLRRSYGRPVADWTADGA